MEDDPDHDYEVIAGTRRHWLISWLRADSYPDTVIAAFASPADVQLKPAYPLAQALDDKGAARAIASMAKRLAADQARWRTEGRPPLPAADVIPQLLDAPKGQQEPSQPYEAAMARRGFNDIPRKLHLMPYDLLRAIHRPTTGRAYELLSQSLDRLVSTTIKTNIRAENRRAATCSWLDGWIQLVDEKTERSRGMTIELSNWFYEGVLMQGGVLSIDHATRCPARWGERNGTSASTRSAPHHRLPRAAGRPPRPGWQSPADHANPTP